MRERSLFRKLRLDAGAAFIALLTLLAPGNGAANSPTHSDQLVPQFVFRSFRQAEGLSNLSVTALSMDSRGFLWVGTQNGLYRFLGSSFQRFGPTEGLPEIVIEDVFAAPDGTVWVGTLKNLYRWTGEAFVPAAAEPIHTWRSSRITAESPGRVLVVDGSRLFRLSYRPDGSVVSYLSVFPDALESANPGLKNLGSISVADGSSQTIWFGCGSRLCSSSHENLTEWGAAQGFPEEYTYAILIDSHASLWAVTEHHVLELPRGGLHFIDRTPPGADPNSVYHRQPIALDPQGRVMVSTGRSLARWNGSTWSNIGVSNGMTFGHIVSLVFDAAGDLWMGSSGQGLHNWAGYNNWEGWSDRQGLPSSDIWSPGSFGAGKTYIGTESGPASIDTATGQVVTLFSSPQWTYGQVGGTVEDRAAGVLWVGTKSGAILRIELRSRKVILAATAPAVILGMLPGPAGQILVLTKKGMFGFNPAGSVNLQKIEQANAATGGPQRISNGCAARDGTLWFASRGVLRLQDGIWSQVPIAGLVSETKTWMGIACSPDGTFWLMGRDAEIWHLTRNKSVLQATALTLPEHYRSLSLVAVLSDLRAWLWIGTDSGLLVWNGSSWRHFTQESGLIWNDVNSGGLAAAPDGSIWIGTSGGAGRLVHPERLFDNVSLPVSVLDIHHGATAVPAQTLMSIPWSSEASFLKSWLRGRSKGGPNRMNFEFAAPGTLNRSDLTFSYRIAELDPYWIETRETSANFAALPPGTYTFEVYANNSALDAVSPVAKIQFRILPPWWLSRWFYISSGLAFVGFLFLLYRLRTRNLVAQRQMLEELVRNRTQELETSRTELLHQATHDGLTGLMNRSAILNALQAEIVRAQRENSALTIVLADLDHFKRVNDTYGHLAGDAALRRFAGALFCSTRTYDVAGRYGGEEFLIVLPGVTSESAPERLEHLHRCVSNLMVIDQERRFEITCSFGSVSIEPRKMSMEQDHALAAADHALYRAKAAGRNRVIHHAPLQEPAYKI